MRQNRYWASRTASDHPDLFWSELKAGRLRQGWGHEAEQDLEIISRTPRSELSDDQVAAARHHRMRGGDGGWQEGDIVLIPNMPHRRMFSLARITGPYRYEPVQVTEKYRDFGHIREVELLTPHGVANSSRHVGSGLRHSLTQRSRTWQIRGREEEFEHVLAHLDNPDLIRESTEVERMEGVVETARQVALDAFGTRFRKDLTKAFGKAEWEAVIAEALKVHFPGAEVLKTGGPAERGADIEIAMPNPLGGPTWTVVIQVKDWKGEAGLSPVVQLRQAIETRNQRDDEGRITTHVVGAVLALTEAEPSTSLEAAMLALERDIGVPVSVIHGDDLLELIMRGILRAESR